jgi:hypothetical protein
MAYSKDFRKKVLEPVFTNHIDYKLYKVYRIGLNL